MFNTSLEYYSVYDTNTGLHMMTLSVPVGMIETQALRENTSRLQIPADAVTDTGIDIPVIAAYYENAINIAAVRVTSLYVTPGQEFVYYYKRAEAEAILTDETTPTPFIDQEASALGVPREFLAAQVQAAVDLFEAKGPQINSIRMGAKKALFTATTPKEIADAISIDWSLT